MLRTAVDKLKEENKNLSLERVVTNIDDKVRIINCYECSMMQRQETSKDVFSTSWNVSPMIIFKIPENRIFKN